MGELKKTKSTKFLLNMIVYDLRHLYLTDYFKVRE